MFGSCVNNLVFKELVINNTLGHLEERNKEKVLLMSVSLPPFEIYSIFQVANLLLNFS